MGSSDSKRGAYAKQIIRRCFWKKLGAEIVHLGAVAITGVFVVVAYLFAWSDTAWSLNF